MFRYEIVNRFIKSREYKSYLEIGVYTGDCFRQINCDRKIGVDPCPVTTVTHKMTSDDFFKQNKETFDIVFIDGLHENEQVYKDIDNSLKVLNKNGVILMHDCIPANEIAQRVPRESSVWNGDTWKAFVRMRRDRDDIRMKVINTDHGIGWIEKSETPTKTLPDNIQLEYASLVNNLSEWLNVVSVDKFKDEVEAPERKIEEKRVQTFLHSGNLGDVIWSLPYVISQKGGDMYIRNYNELGVVNVQYDLLYRLLVSQPYIRKVKHYPVEYANKPMYQEGLEVGLFKKNYMGELLDVEYASSIDIDIDLDYFRISPYLRKEHLITSYFRVNNEQIKSIPFPFLKINVDFDFKNDYLNERIEIPSEEYNLFQITQRYRDDFDWGELIKGQEKTSYYIGLRSEYEIVCEKYKLTEKHLKHLVTKDLFDVAILIKSADKIFCNPSVVNAISVGLNKDYYIRIPKEQEDVITNLPIENILD